MRFPLLPIALALATLPAVGAEPPVTAEELPRPKPLEPAESLAGLKVHPGFKVELMAAEPMVEGPVAMAFDENGRLYVVEMRDYPESRAEKLGRVRLLEDTDGDGRYDKASVFAEDLPWPTGITCWDGGVFVLASPDLIYLKDTDGDRKADVHALVFTGFGNKAAKLNVQALPNSLQWGPDQRIHGALGGNPGSVLNFAWHGQPKIEFQGKDFSFDPAQMDLRPESGGGQFGMTFDPTGRKYVCSNSRHLVQIMYEQRVAERVTDYPLPAPGVDIPADGPQAEVFRLSPDEAWRVIRTKWRVSGAVKGMIEGGGRASGYFTSASGVTIYKGDAWPQEYRGDAFVADCGSNLIHHKKLSGDLVRKGERAPDEQKSEFIASPENWFRPVAFANAPDGNLWFADMYREVIEHPWALPDSLKQHLDLTSGRNRGRLYRIVADNAANSARPTPGNASSAELVAMLEHPNGWHRETAARLLHQKQDSAVAPALAKLATESRSPVARIAALQVLNGLSMLAEATLRAALKDGESDVRANAVRLCSITGYCPDAVLALANDPSARVRAEVAWALVGSKSDGRIDALASLLQKDDEPWIRHAALAAAGADVEPVLAKLSSTNPDRAQTLRASLGAKSATAKAVPQFAATGTRKDAVAQYAPALNLTGDAAKGALIYDARCALCHRLRGKGNRVGPDLDAAHTSGKEKVLGNILEPSRELTAGFAMANVTLKSGEIASGIMDNETPAGVILRLPGGSERVIRRSEIGKVERLQKSLMPEGIEGGLTVQEMADLLEFITAPPVAK